VDGTLLLLFPQLSAVHTIGARPGMVREGMARRLGMVGRETRRRRRVARGRGWCPGDGAPPQDGALQDGAL